MGCAIFWIRGCGGRKLRRIWKGTNDCLTAQGVISSIEVRGSLSCGGRNIGKRLVEVYTANGDIDILHEGDTLSGEEVLLGFTMPVTDFFADPFTD